MDETTKVLIGTISGFLIAFFAEPIKIYFSNNFKKRNIRLALYKEFYHNIYLMQPHLIKDKNGFEKLHKHFFIFDAYNHFIAKETETFYQLKESGDLIAFYKMLNLILLRSFEDPERQRHIEAFYFAFTSALEEKNIDRRIFLSVSTVNKEELERVIGNLKPT